LVQASSSLSMTCARAWPIGATRQRNPFPPFFARVFYEESLLLQCHELVRIVTLPLNMNGVSTYEQSLYI